MTSLSINIFSFLSGVTLLLWVIAVVPDVFLVTSSVVDRVGLVIRSRFPVLLQMFCDA